MCTHLYLIYYYSHYYYYYYYDDDHDHDHHHDHDHDHHHDHHHHHHHHLLFECPQIVIKGKYLDTSSSFVCSFIHSLYYIQHIVIS